MEAPGATQQSPAEDRLRSWSPDPRLPGWFNDTRQRAIKAYFDSSYPDRTSQRWHYGNPHDFALTDLDLAGPLMDETQSGVDTVAQLTGPIADSFIMLMAGSTVTNLHTTPALRDLGILLTGFHDALGYFPKQIEDFWRRRQFDFESDRIAASYRALPEEGFFLYVPRGVQLKQPIHLAVVATEPGKALAPYILLLLEDQCSVDVYVHLVGTNDTSSNLLLGLLEAEVGEDAKLSVTTVQDLGEATNALFHQSFVLGREASLRSMCVNLGGRRVRHELFVDLAEPGASADLYGMHLLRGKERYDFHTTQDHKAPHCRSNLLYKGAMLGKSRASFQGIINVAPQAQKTDAYQSNRSLLLSPNARVESSPQLEILANDVKCSHGSSVTNVSEEAVFYLTSRGIDPHSARDLLVSGFLREVSGRIGQESVREYVSTRVLEQME